ncbi:MAG: adenine phosphoribosyltransferase [Thaumarchaeota archaeon]|nr:adenine phosphoribosyltransferase [Nitrososphaerota archaeon]MCY3976288.1 adenine phosphoribosyltransferase [Nitrososphaerota archaeon]
MDLIDKIKEFRNFPKKGIQFKDFSEILKSPLTLRYVCDEISKYYHTKDVDVFAGIESRGFPIACALAIKYNKGMIMIRKKGKLPGKTTQTQYKTEYEKSVMEIQNDAVKKNQRIIICDDLLATGGTAQAAAKIIEKRHGKVAGFAFIIELTELGGRNVINKYKCKTLIQY